MEFLMSDIIKTEPGIPEMPVTPHQNQSKPSESTYFEQHDLTVTKELLDDPFFVSCFEDITQITEPSSLDGPVAPPASQFPAKKCEKKPQSNGQFTCSLCSASFRTRSILRQHYAVHSSSRPYECDVCRKSFSRRSTVISHRLTHGSEKAFTCEICGKAFHQKGNMINHTYTHSNARPYKCEICGNGFNQKSNLACHRKKFHGGNKENFNPNQSRDNVISVPLQNTFVVDQKGCITL